MKAARAILVLLVLVFAAADLIASGPVGIYGMIEKVIFEPNEKSPERIQVWGAFAFVDGGLSGPGVTSKPQRGYLYFTLPPGNAQLAAKTEWADLKAVAGAGQAIGFGNWGYTGPFTFDGLALRTGVRVRPQSEAPASPDVYWTNAGIVKLNGQGNRAGIVKQLREALSTR